MKKPIGTLLIALACYPLSYFPFLSLLARCPPLAPVEFIYAPLPTAWMIRLWWNLDPEGLRRFQQRLG